MARRNKQASKSAYEGLQTGVRSFSLPAVETWTNQYPGQRTMVDMVCEEFTCVCPKTGLPDFATLDIRYVPLKKCLELKSLKLYLTAFRALGIFHEHAVNRIADDLVKACGPKALRVQGRFKSRGGIVTTATALRGRFQAGELTGPL